MGDLIDAIAATRALLTPETFLFDDGGPIAVDAEGNRARPQIGTAARFTWRGAIIAAVRDTPRQEELIALMCFKLGHWARTRRNGKPDLDMILEALDGVERLVRIRRRDRL